MSDGTCPVDDPEGHSPGGVYCKGLCAKHYKRQYRNGTTDKLKPGQPRGHSGSEPELLHARIVRNVNIWGCWEYDGAHNEHGYGIMRVWRDGRWRNRRVHLLAWEDVNTRPVPTGLVLDHFLFPETCIGPPCCNPEHVRPTTQKLNSLRSSSPTAINARKTHCPQGHPYDIIRWGNAKSGGPRRRRECSICVAETARRRVQRNRAEKG